MDNTVQAYRVQRWTETIRECAESREKKREYCQEHGINEKTFYYRQRRLRDRMSSNLQNRLGEDCLPNPFVRLSVPMDNSGPEGGESAVIVRVGSIRIEIRDSVDEALLAKVLRAASHVG